MTKPLLQRWIPVMILTAACGLGLAGFAWSLIATAVENHTAIMATRQRLDELTTRRIDPAALASHRARLEAVSAREAGLLTVPAEAEASGRLEASLRTVLQARGAQLMLMRQAGPVADENGAKALRMSISLRIPEDQIIQVLANLEAGPPVVFFEEIHLHRPESTSNADAGRLELKGTIRVYLDVIGHQERRS